jgi:hypothetical protein
MTEKRRAREVAVDQRPLPVPDPYADCEYGPIRDEILKFIDEHTDQDELAGGAVGQHFEW